MPCIHCSVVLPLVPTCSQAHSTFMQGQLHWCCASLAPNRSCFFVNTDQCAQPKLNCTLVLNSTCSQHKYSGHPYIWEKPMQNTNKLQVMVADPKFAGLADPVAKSGEMWLPLCHNWWMWWKSFFTLLLLTMCNSKTLVKFQECHTLQILA